MATVHSHMHPWPYVMGPQPDEPTAKQIVAAAQRILQEVRAMHYRNGREAKNGDKIVKLQGGTINSFGVLHSAVPGNDHCNGNIAVIQPAQDYACLCDCLHVDDIAEILKERELDKRPAGM